MDSMMHAELEDDRKFGEVDGVPSNMMKPKDLEDAKNPDMETISPADEEVKEY